MMWQRARWGRRDGTFLLLWVKAQPPIVKPARSIWTDALLAAKPRYDVAVTPRHGERGVTVLASQVELLAEFTEAPIFLPYQRVPRLKHTDADTREV
jgi:hypothetical protein